MKLEPKRISLAIFLTVGLFILLHATFVEFLKLNQEWRDLISVIGFSVFGIFLVFMRRTPTVNHYLVESVEVLILGIVPTIASFRLVAVNELGKNLLGGMIILIDVIWFSYFYILKKNTGKEEDVKQAKKIILIVFLEILFMGLITFGFIVSISHL